jgi:hypothetical protein
LTVRHLEMWYIPMKQSSNNKTINKKEHIFKSYSGKFWWLIIFIYFGQHKVSIIST